MVKSSLVFLKFGTEKLKTNHTTLTGFFINRATCSQAVTNLIERRSDSVSSRLSQHSRDENRKLIQETFDIKKETSPIRSERKLVATAEESECDYDSDGDHEHIIQHIQRNR